MHTCASFAIRELIMYFMILFEEKMTSSKIQGRGGGKMKIQGEGAPIVASYKYM